MFALLPRTFALINQRGINQPTSEVSFCLYFFASLSPLFSPCLSPSLRTLSFIFLFLPNLSLVSLCLSVPLQNERGQCPWTCLSRWRTPPPWQRSCTAEGGPGLALHPPASAAHPPCPSTTRPLRQGSGPDHYHEYPAVRPRGHCWSEGRLPVPEPQLSISNPQTG